MMLHCEFFVSVGGETSVWVSRGEGGGGRYSWPYRSIRNKQGAIGLLVM